MLIKEEKAATAAYQAALACLSTRAQKNQYDPISVQPVADIAQVTAWINALHEGSPGEACRTSQPIVHTKWLYDFGQPGFTMSPTTWATAFINHLVQQMATRAIVTQVAHMQAAAATDPAPQAKGCKRSCSRLDEEAGKGASQTESSAMETGPGEGTLAGEPEEKNSPAAIPLEDPA